MLARPQSLLGAQHLALLGLESRGDEAFGAGQGLAALVVGRNLVEVRAGHLEVVPEHAVVADLEARNPGAPALRRLELGDPPLAGMRQVVELVARTVVAGADHASLARDRRRIVDQRSLEALLKGRLDGQGLSKGHAGRVLEAGERGQDRPDPVQGVPHRAQVARRGLSARQPGAQPLQVGEALQRFAKRRAPDPARDPGLNRGMALSDCGRLGERALEPGAQPARPECRDGQIQVVPEGVAGLACRLRMEQLQVASRCQVVAQRGFLAQALDPRELEGRSSMGPVEIVERRRGGSQRQRQVGGQRPGLRAPAAAREIDLQEPSPGNRAPRSGQPTEQGLQTLRQRRLELTPERDHPLGHAEPGEDRRGLFPVELAELDLPGRSIRDAHAEPLGPGPQRGEEVVGCGIEEGIHDHRARGQDLGYAALDDSLGLRGVLELVADRHLVPETQEPAHVGVALVPRDPAHRDRLGILLVARREREAEQGRPPHGVLEEHLVEVTEAEEQEGVGILFLDARVLPHERRACRRRR